MSAAYVVTAEVVQALLDMGPGESQTYRHFYMGSSLPPNVDKDQLERLIGDGMVEKQDVADAAAADVGEWNGPKGVNVADVLAYVGDDPERAADVLEQEEAGDNRTTLISKLEKIVDPAAD